jgi:hypothetical protein
MVREMMGQDSGETQEMVLQEEDQQVIEGQVGQSKKLPFFAHHIFVFSFLTLLLFNVNKELWFLKLRLNYNYSLDL